MTFHQITRFCVKTWDLQNFWFTIDFCKNGLINEYLTSKTWIWHDILSDHEILCQKKMNSMQYFIRSRSFASKTWIWCNILSDHEVLCQKHEFDATFRQILCQKHEFNVTFRQIMAFQEVFHISFSHELRLYARISSHHVILWIWHHVSSDHDTIFQGSYNVSYNSSKFSSIKFL